MPRRATRLYAPVGKPYSAPYITEKGLLRSLRSAKYSDGVMVRGADPVSVDSDQGQRPRVLGISDVRFLRVFTP